jgi:DNA-binding NarL/FixJ family response regulator
VEGAIDGCPVCDRAPVVLVAIRHPVMRRWTDELLASEHGCWTVVQPERGELLAAAIVRSNPALVVVDEVDFPACCQAALRTLSPERVIVVGPEPDAAYRSAALAHGAGGWVCRDHVGEELSAAMRGALGCRHDPCPPWAVRRRPTEACVQAGGGHL